MTAVTPFDTAPTASPFDRIKQARPDGTEFWSARDLMPLLGYDRWERMPEVVGRAQASASNISPSGDHIRGASKMITLAKGAERLVHDFHLSRFGCYLVAMNGDPRKPEIAAAQAYFAIRTREAETAKPLTGPELLARAVLEAAETIKALEAQVKADAPKVLFANAVAGSDTSILIRELAKILKARGVDTGERRLYETLRQEGFLIKAAGRDWNSPTQKAMDLKLFEIKEITIGSPSGTKLRRTTLVTGRGQQYFVERYVQRAA